MNFFGPSRENPSSPDEQKAADDLALLILETRQNDAFQALVLSILELPDAQRRAFIHSAVREMEAQKEPSNLRTAFLSLANPNTAAAVARTIRGA
jgi:hypothetical protein